MHCLKHLVKLLNDLFFIYVNLDPFLTLSQSLASKKRRKIRIRSNLYSLHYILRRLQTNQPRCSRLLIQGTQNCRFQKILDDLPELTDSLTVFTHVYSCIIHFENTTRPYLVRPQTMLPLISLQVFRTNTLFDMQ